MRYFANILFFYSIVAMFLVMGCTVKETYSEVPAISFVEIKFIDSPANTASSDSLVLKFSYTDESGDIGFNSEENFDPPFHEYDILIDSNDSIVTKSNYNNLTPPIYKAPLITRSIEFVRIENETLYFINSPNNHPILGYDKEEVDISDFPFLCPYIGNFDGATFNDINLNIYYINNNLLNTITRQVNEEMIIISNETYYNMHIEWLRLEGDAFVPLNFQEILNSENCEIGNFNGIIPIFLEENRAGNITYNMRSNAFKVVFQDYLIKLRFYIYDRALNRSNIDSVEFYLPDIIQ